MIIFFHNISFKTCQISMFSKNCCVINYKFILMQYVHYFNNIVSIMNGFKNNLNSVAENKVIMKLFFYLFIFVCML